MYLMAARSIPGHYITLHEADAEPTALYRGEVRYFAYRNHALVL